MKTEEEFDKTLRAGLRAIVAVANSTEPADYVGTGMKQQHSRTRWLAGVAIVLVVTVASVAVVMTQRGKSTQTASAGSAAHIYGLNRNGGHPDDSLRICLNEAGLTANNEGNIQITNDGARSKSEACVRDFLKELESVVPPNEREAKASAFLREFIKCMSERDYHVSLDKLPLGPTSDSEAHGSGATEIRFAVDEDLRPSFKADYAACTERGEEAETAAADD